MQEKYYWDGGIYWMQMDSEGGVSTHFIFMHKIINLALTHGDYF